MNELIVQKVIARDGSREIINCDVEGMHKFIVDGIRPEFDDKKVICVQFLQSYYEGDESPEASVWYINPYYSTNCQGEGNMFEGSIDRAYGPFMDSAFIPEIILIDIDNVDIVLKKFAAFNNCLDFFDLTHASDEEKLIRFVAEYNNIEA